MVVIFTFSTVAEIAVVLGMPLSRVPKIHIETLPKKGLAFEPSSTIHCASIAMTLCGYAILFLGVIVCLYGQVRFLVVAYKRSLWWFFGCLFVPFVDWVFIFLNFNATIGPFAISICGMIVAFLGAWMAGVPPVAGS
jgi:hypothetical protein